MSFWYIPKRGAEKPLAGCSKRSRCEAREKSTSGGLLTVRCSEAIERQRSIWVFFSSLLSGGFFSGVFALRACMFEFGVDFTADQNDKSADVHPGQQHDDRADTAVGLVV